MKRRNKTRTPLLKALLIPLLFASFIAPAAHAQNLVANGSFESGYYENNWGVSGYDAMLVQAGWGAITSWEIPTYEIRWLPNSNGFGPTTPYGNYFLNLTSKWIDPPTYGSVLQYVAPLTIGKEYRLSFALDTSVGSSAYLWANAITANKMFYITVSSEQDHWQTFALVFVANSTTMAIELQGSSVDGGRGTYLGLDNVSVVAKGITGEFDPVDCDVDGSDLAALIAHPELLDVTTFAQNFGKKTEECFMCTPGNSRPCYNGPPGSKDVGECKGGIETCNAEGTGYGLCQGEVVPTAEVCGDWLDNDCDGIVDEDC